MDAGSGGCCPVCSGLVLVDRGNGGDAAAQGHRAPLCLFYQVDLPDKDQEANGLVTAGAIVKTLLCLDVG